MLKMRLRFHLEENTMAARATKQEQEQFINTIAPLIQAEAIRRGYLVCSPIIAQAIIESAYGKSLLASKHFNFWGMKCGSYWRGASVNMKTKEEFQVGTLTTIRSNFRAYPDMQSGVAGYFDFISTPRYENLKTADNPQLYLTRIKADGYATSSSYVATNMKYIQLHNLTRFDVDMPLTSSNPYHAPDRLLKVGTTGNGVKWLQYELNKQGYDLKIDGIFGPATEDAVRQFQNASMLVCDGIVGPKTIAALIE